MKKILLSVFLLSSLFFSFTTQALAGYVNGYYRSNGTYVNGYYRTEADGNPYNNYSYPGNYNPNKGTITGGSASTYLNNYYKTSTGSSYSAPSYSYTATPSCPLNSYYNGSSCSCNSGYVVSGSSCTNATLYCMDKIGIMSQYNSLSKKCECMAGYELSGSTCTYKTSSPSPYYYTTPSYTSSADTCPLHSHDSLTDSTMCTCDTGYVADLVKNVCISKSKLPTGCTTTTGFSVTTGRSCSK